MSGIDYEKIYYELTNRREAIPLVTFKRDMFGDKKLVKLGCYSSRDGEILFCPSTEELPSGLTSRLLYSFVDEATNVAIYAIDMTKKEALR